MVFWGGHLILAVKLNDFYRFGAYFCKNIEKYTGIGRRKNIIKYTGIGFHRNHVHSGRFLRISHIRNTPPHLVDGGWWVGGLVGWWVGGFVGWWAGGLAGWLAGYGTW